MEGYAIKKVNKEQVYSDPAIQKIGAAAVHLLKNGRRVTPLTLYMQLIQWEKVARSTAQKTTYCQALRLLSQKLN